VKSAVDAAVDVAEDGFDDDWVVASQMMEEVLSGLLLQKFWMLLKVGVFLEGCLVSGVAVEVVFVLL